MDARLRQSNLFAGLLLNQERNRILRQFHLASTRQSADLDVIYEGLFIRRVDQLLQSRTQLRRKARLPSGVNQAHLQHVL